VAVPKAQASCQPATNGGYQQHAAVLSGKFLFRWRFFDDYFS
jgi:hypothetical protein